MRKSPSSTKRPPKPTSNSVLSYSTSPTFPTTPRPSAPTPAHNPVVRTWGDKPAFPDGREPEDHLKVGARLGLFDLERAAKISGSGFVCFTGAGARLERSLLNFLLDLHSGQHGYTEVSPPFIVRRDCMVGTTQLPKFEDDMYGLENNTLFLAPTAEVPVTNLHREEILPAESLPKKFCAYTPCLFPPRGRFGGTRDAWVDPSASVRQSRAGQDHDAGNQLRGIGEPDRQRGKGAPTPGTALPRDRTLARATWVSVRQKPTTSRSGHRRNLPIWRFRVVPISRSSRRAG